MGQISYHFDDSRTLQMLDARWSTFSDRFHNVSFTMQSHDHNWSLPLSYDKTSIIPGFVFSGTHCIVYIYRENCSTLPSAVSHSPMHLSIDIVSTFLIHCRLMNRSSLGHMAPFIPNRRDRFFSVTARTFCDVTINVYEAARIVGMPHYGCANHCNRKQKSRV